MSKRKITDSELASVLARINAVADLPVEFTDIEVQAMDEELAEETQRSLLFDFGTVPAPENKDSAPVTVTTPVPSRTQHTTIRLPAPVLAAYKAKARATGTKYQTLIVRTLRAVSTSW